MRSICRIACLLLLSLFASAAVAVPTDCPPIPQPTSSDPVQAPAPPVQVTTITRTHVENGDASYCLYEPPTAGQHGVLLYNHGWQVSEVGALDPMLQFIAQSGYFVVYPYLTDWDPAQWSGAPTWARNALYHAIFSLAVTQRFNGKIAVAGHSLGALAAVRVAATWQGPRIRAIILHEPAGIQFLPLVGGDEFGLTADALKSISCNTYLLIVGAEKSESGSDFENSAARPIWKSLPQIARYAGTSGTVSQRNFLLVRHDVSHTPIRISDHLVVLASPDTFLVPTHLTSMDYYGYWRPLLGGLERAFAVSAGSRGIYSPYCNASVMLPACKDTRSMGRWRDKVLATPMLNAADLGLFPQPGPIPNHCLAVQAGGKDR